VIQALPGVGPRHTPGGAAAAPDAVAQPWGIATSLAAVGGAIGYAYESMAAGATLGTLALPGVGTAVGAAGGLLLAGLGALGASYYYAETPEAKQRRETIEAALDSYRQLDEDINKLDLSRPKDRGKRTAVLEQITSRIGKLERLLGGTAGPKDDLDEVLGWAENAATSVQSLTTASETESVSPDDKHGDSKEATIPSTYAYAYASASTSRPKAKVLKERIDATLAGLVGLREGRLPPCRKKATPSSGSYTPSAPESYAKRKAKVLGEVEGEFRSWAKDESHIGVMFHSAATIQHGPYSHDEKEGIRKAINSALQGWITSFPYIDTAKVLHGKEGKGENFNIGAYANDKQVLNLHFIW